jgi:hypothetical protein
MQHLENEAKTEKQHATLGLRTASILDQWKRTLKILSSPASGQSVPSFKILEILLTVIDILSEVSDTNVYLLRLKTWLWLCSMSDHKSVDDVKGSTMITFVYFGPPLVGMLSFTVCESSMCLEEAAGDPGESRMPR